MMATSLRLLFSFLFLLSCALSSTDLMMDDPVSPDSEFPTLLATLGITKHADDLEAASIFNSNSLAALDEDTLRGMGFKLGSRRVILAWSQSWTESAVRGKGGATRSDEVSQTRNVSAKSTIGGQLVDYCRTSRPEFPVPDTGKKNVSDSIKPLFWTPIWKHGSSALGSGSDFSLAKLRKLIRKLQKTKSAIHSNVGSTAWQYDGDLLDLKAPAVPALKREIIYLIHEYMRAFAVSNGAELPSPYILSLRNAWANVNFHADHNMGHVHPETHVSGVLYLDTGGDSSSAVVFEDPRTDRPVMADVGIENEIFSPAWTSASVQVPTEAGMAVLFPSWLKHHVLPHIGKRPRMSISFNALLMFKDPNSKELRTNPMSSLLHKPRHPDSAGTVGQVADFVKDWRDLGLEPGLVSTGPRPGGYNLHWAVPCKELHVDGVDRVALAELVGHLQSRHSDGWDPREGFRSPAAVRVDWLDAAAHAGDHAGAVNQLRTAIHDQIYWYEEEMLRGTTKHRSEEPLPFDVQITTSTFRTMRGGENADSVVQIQSVDSGAHVCGIYAVSGAPSQIRLNDPRAASDFEGAILKPDIIYLSLLPGGMFLLPCAQSVDILPVTNLDTEDRIMVQFAARVVRTL